MNQLMSNASLPMSSIAPYILGHLPGREKRNPAKRDPPMHTRDGGQLSLSDMLNRYRNQKLRYTVLTVRKIHPRLQGSALLRECTHTFNGDPIVLTYAIYWF